MDVRIISNAGDEIAYADQIPTRFLPYRLRGATPITTHSGFGDMLFQNFAGKGFDIWYSVYGITHPVTLIARADLAVLELHIPFKNKMASKWDGISHTLMSEKQFDLSFTPHVFNEVKFERTAEHHTFDIHYHKETLEQFSPYFPILATFLEKVEKNEPASLLNSICFLSPDMIRTINEMLAYDFIDSLAPAFYESKAMELLIQMLRHISAFKAPDQSFSKMYAAYAEAAKNLILSDLEHQFTASELARHTGTNVYTVGQELAVYNLMAEVQIETPIEQEIEI